MITYILCAVIILQALFHAFERRDLYSRIMSKDLTEFKSAKKNTYPVSAHRRIIDRWRGRKSGDK